MPSTYDPLLRLELQATGENATTWGIKTNTNLDLLAESIAGAVTLDVAGSGDFTLTTASGAEDQARYAILVLTGLLTGNRTIIVPSSPKNYTVINQTTGAFTVTLKQSAGTGLVIPRDGPTITVCTSTTCVDSIGATPYTKTLLATTSAAPALTILGATSVGAAIFNATDTSAARSAIGATSVGSALIIASDTTAGRSAIGAAATGPIGSSGVTMNTARLLGRSTASSGAVEEITVGSGLSLAAGSIDLAATPVKAVRPVTITSSGTYTTPSGVTALMFFVSGATGGKSNPSGNGGATGGAGYSEKYIASPAASYSITIGAGGTPGNAGGTTTIDTISITGAAGTSTNTGSSGGTASGGTFNANGGSGGTGNINGGVGGGGAGGSRAGAGFAGGNAASGNSGSGGGGGTGSAGSAGSGTSGGAGGAAATTTNASAITLNPYWSPASGRANFSAGTSGEEGVGGNGASGSTIGVYEMSMLGGTAGRGGVWGVSYSGSPGVVLIWEFY